ncbi:N-acetylglucosamine kinase [Streptomyces sp. ME19-01-6]|uniref:N-acetylglucosamine kinase n=1 Tax=Streptomyces sp. ME19-01-6 TaxID=3028686 RepID=UPI0029BB9361|nr:BadF/BadG/BcrA/BcrD ATPase family protein [Streptomyces sp. ME19-01-6]MDX3230517.1 BadF/BadG/BcrA/BcrD ATPase family protein [Streptomyces sp. ME19-01-6]
MVDRAERRFVLGIDSGGSGVRVALARADALSEGDGDGGEQRDGHGSDGPANGRANALSWSSSVPTPAVVGDRGIDADSLLARVLPAARALLREAGADRVAAVCVGAAGMASLGDDLRAKLPDALASSFGARRLALAADGVTAYAGALGQRPGAVVAAGTGLIALGALPDGAAGAGGGWRRADGWGHLLGDCGGGAWIGRAGLEAAMRAYDGREGGSRPLLARLEAVLGQAGELPGKLYPRPDRPAVLASFAPEVGRCAERDPVATAILRDAARHIAQAAEAVCPDVEGRVVALTGGLFRMGAPLLVPLRAQLAERLPHARVTEAAGDPLTGAVRIAAALATDSLRLSLDAALLRVMDVGPVAPER